MVSKRNLTRPRSKKRQQPLKDVKFIYRHINPRQVVIDQAAGPTGRPAMKEYTFRDHLKEELKDPYFKELHELSQQKLEVVKKIIAYRIRHKLNQRQLAKQLGVSQQHISNIENGTFSSVATLEKVLLGIGYSVKIQAVPLSGKARNRLNKVLSRG